MFQRIYIFLLDINYEWYPEYLRPIDKHWPASSPWLRNYWNATHCCSNGSVFKRLVRLIYMSHVYLISRTIVLIPKIIFPVFVCEQLLLITNMWNTRNGDLCFWSSTVKISGCGHIQIWLTRKIGIIFTYKRNRTFRCKCEL